MQRPTLEIKGDGPFEAEVFNLYKCVTLNPGTVDLFKKHQNLFTLLFVYSPSLCVLVSAFSVTLPLCCVEVRASV